MAIKPITPKAIDINDHKQAIDKGLLALVGQVANLFEYTYWNWESENVPEFTTEGPKDYANGRAVGYSTESIPYVYVSNGTPAHDISAKHAKFLAFQTGGSPKTQPGNFKSMSGSAPNGDWVFRKKVRHPGNKAREFPKEILKQMSNKMAQPIQDEIDKVL